jgi:hypothetical protein
MPNPTVGLQSIITDPVRGSTWGPKSYRERTTRFVLRPARLHDPTESSGKKRTIGRIDVIFPSKELAEWKLWVANDDVIDTIPWRRCARAWVHSRGDGDMSWTRDRWMRFLFAGFCITASQQGSGAAVAQGFGPDPFRPFNSQYDQYVYPIRPETGGAAAPARGLSRGETTFERWMNEQDGGSRLDSDRSGVGGRYWRVRTDLESDRRELAKKRNARRNAETGSITQKYLAYFSEENPTKRAILLRDYSNNRRGAETESPDDRTDRAAPRGRAGGRANALGARGSSEKAGEEKSTRRIPPAPPLSGVSRGSSRSQRRPSDVLDRARRTDDDNMDSEKSPSSKRSTRRSPAAPPIDE